MVRHQRGEKCRFETEGDRAMPTNTTFVVAAIAIIFTIFALVLARADHRTTR
jgi:hypothetical protein